MSDPHLLVASSNRGKILEIEALLAPLGLRILTPRDLGVQIDVLEDGDSYQANAIKKAKAFYRISGMVVLADDSGLEVDVLQGAPGVHSARYAPLANASDKDRRDYLLAQLARKPRPWQARFRAVIAIADQTGSLHIVEGDCPGEIIAEERGEAGFGYDPIFQLENLPLTMAELSLEQKNRLSHRGRAITKALPLLADIFDLEVNKGI